MRRIASCRSWSPQSRAGRFQSRPQGSAAPLPRPLGPLWASSTRGRSLGAPRAAALIRSADSNTDISPQWAFTASERWKPPPALPGLAPTTARPGGSSRRRFQAQCREPRACSILAMVLPLRSLAASWLPRMQATGSCRALSRRGKRTSPSARSPTTKRASGASCSSKASSW